MLIEILGSGCAKCEKLRQNAEQAVRESRLDARIEKVTDLAEIAAFGVMITPALAVDGVVKVSGKVPGVEEIKQFLAG